MFTRQLSLIFFTHAEASLSPEKQRIKTASELCFQYNNILHARLTRHSIPHVQLPDYWRLTESYRVWFNSAAELVLTLSAEPRQFIEAQFDAFAKIRTRGSRVRLFIPRPHQLFGLGAQLRYIEHLAAVQHVKNISAEGVETQHRPFYREDRKLRSLSTISHLPEADVLAQMPTEFTEKYLKHRGVWDLVKSEYNAD